MQENQNYMILKLLYFFNQQDDGTFKFFKFWYLLNIFSYISLDEGKKKEKIQMLYKFIYVNMWNIDEYI